MKNGNTNSTFYWPKWHKFADNGNLTMKVTGYEGDCHWTGSITVEPTEPDYALWVWIIKEKKCAKLIDDGEFEKLKQEFVSEAS